MKDQLYRFIKAFGMLTDDEVQFIVDNTVVKSFKKGTILLNEGQVAKKCYLVLKGLVREYYLVDGIEKSTAFYTEEQPVTPFTSLTTQEPSKHFLVCGEDCVLTEGTQDLEQEMCAKIPRLNSIIRDEVEKDTGKAKDEFAAFMTSSPEGRYENLMRDRPELFNRVPQHQIASYLGVTPESLSRIRKRLHQKV